MRVSRILLLLLSGTTTYQSVKLNLSPQTAPFPIMWQITVQRVTGSLRVRTNHLLPTVSRCTWCSFDPHACPEQLLPNPPAREIRGFVNSQFRIVAPNRTSPFFQCCSQLDHSVDRQRRNLDRLFFEAQPQQHWKILRLMVLQVLSSATILLFSCCAELKNLVK